MKLILDNGIQIITEPEPWKKGGEGNVYKVISPVTLSNKVVKIYHEFKQQKYDKCVYLKNNPINRSGARHQPIVWIDNLVFDEHQNFKGIIMKKAEGIDLYALCNQRLRPRIHQYYQKFDFKNPAHFDNRLKLCYNICSSVHAAHKQNKYILADLKAQNILIDTNGFIYIIDTDNIAVIENRQVKFSPEVTSPEISPPEHYALENIHEKFTLNWDRFSMAVVLFQILFGIHPFTGTCEAPYQDCNDFPSKIKNKLFPFGPKRGFFKVVPGPLRKFQNIPMALKTLFLRAFTGPYNNRPHTLEWLEAIAGKAANNLWSPKNKNGTNLPAIATQLQLNLHAPKYNFFQENNNFIFEPITQKPYALDVFSGISHFLTGRYDVYRLKKRYNRIHSETRYTFKARQYQYNNNLVQLNRIKSEYRDELLNLKKEVDSRLLKLEQKYKDFCVKNDGLIQQINQEYAAIEQPTTSKTTTSPVKPTNPIAKIATEKKRKIQQVIQQAHRDFAGLKRENEDILSYYERKVNRLKTNYNLENKEVEYELIKMIDQEKRWKSEIRHLEDQIKYS